MIRSGWHRRLSVQLVALLSLALLPLGLVAIFQTNRVAEEASQNRAMAFLGLTEQAAEEEQVLIERAIGAARMIGSLAPDLLAQPELCAPALSRFITADTSFSFVGILPPSGIMNCTSVEEVVDVTDYPKLDELMANQELAILVEPNASVSGESVFIVSEPYFIDGVMSGRVSVSIPHSGLPQTETDLTSYGLIELLTFNADGTILTARSGFDVAEREVPRDRDLAGLSIQEAQTFRAENKDGIKRRYTIVTIEGSPAAVMGVWSVASEGRAAISAWIIPAAFPILMWVASMGVAMLAMNTLVLRHLRRLRDMMNRFSETRETGNTESRNVLKSTEIEMLEANFQRMSAEILQDEAELENKIYEKNVLVKEIHHRVKNNLQLISSIMNMQMRAAQHDETRDVLRRVQDRVISLATIHRDLYQSQSGGRVNVGALISEIVDKTLDLGVDGSDKMKVSTDISAVLLYPDQAVPLSLLVSEAIVNAMKYASDFDGDEPACVVVLKQDDRACLLVISNRIGTRPRDDQTGLGRQLMNAFALQLGGKLEVEHTDERYTLTLSFNALEFAPEARDF